MTERELCQVLLGVLESNSSFCTDDPLDRAALADIVTAELTYAHQLVEPEPRKRD